MTRSVQDPVGRLLVVSVPAMVAEFEAYLARMRTREGMKVATAKGRLPGKQPKLSPKQEAHLVAVHQAVSTRSASWRSCSPPHARPVSRAIARGGDRAAS